MCKTYAKYIKLKGLFNQEIQIWQGNTMKCWNIQTQIPFYTFCRKKKNHLSVNN